MVPTELRLWASFYWRLGVVLPIQPNPETLQGCGHASGLRLIGVQDLCEERS
ncbi:uncharacterized protein CTRU02_215593 [Colletotrichum truncatum]|uniref:Uncharacterized protein n=1 Tax=Colletotrichum truncatum TaxID=5467 RepID=A0ACC3YCB1_COLTU|nr:uncharacterized protein CTRU02_05473 [Colletotrichum truncatum]KAF6793916.1 hypothetical protein CTRU02_05473 [Colletotrichum truncatum]